MNKNIRKKLLASVQYTYEAGAEDFSRTRHGLVWPETDTLIKSVIAKQSPLPNPLRVLDLGCGSGRLLDTLKYYAIAYRGIDVSDTLVQHTRKKIKKLELTHATAETGDITTLFATDQPQETYHLMLLIAVLPHIPSRALRIATLRNLRKHLAHNGRIIITCWNLREHPKHRHTIWRHNVLKCIGLNRMEFGDIIFPGFTNNLPRYYHAYTKRQLRKELIRADYTIEKLYSDPKNIYAVAS